jgi:hypothetical protein
MIAVNLAGRISMDIMKDVVNNKTKCNLYFTTMVLVFTNSLIPK